MYKKQALILMVVIVMVFVGITGCSDKAKEKDEKTTDSVQTVEVTTDTKIFDGKRENRSFMISEACYKTGEYYIDKYAIEKEDSKDILHLKGNIRAIGTMDGEVSTITEAKLEIADECVFHDNRSEYKDQPEMNLDEFKKHISSEEFHKPMHIEITVDNGLVWLVELAN